MTIALNKPVSRAVALHPGEVVIVTLSRTGILFRLKGTRTTYTLPYELGYQRAASPAADVLRAERRRAPAKASRGLLAVGRGR